MPRKTQSVRSVDKAMLILEVVGASKAGLTIPEIVERTNIPKSSVHCILLTFARNGYLRRTERAGRYAFDVGFLKLVMSAPLSPRLRLIAAPYLRELMGRSRLTVHLAAMEGGEGLIIAKCQPASVVPISTRPGQKVILHATSLGKSLLAAIPENQCEELLCASPLSRFNDRTLVSLPRLQQEIQVGLQRGFSVADEESELGLRCVGVPIPSGVPGVIAAISVAGADCDLPRDRFSRVAALLQHAASEIGKSLRPAKPERRKPVLVAATG